MNKLFNDIKVLIWDFDGTLYKPNPALWQAVREAEYRTIMEHTGWSREFTDREFTALHRQKIKSATAVTAFLTKIAVSQAAIEMEQYFDRRKYLHRDIRLIRLFKKLSHFRHFTLANGVINRHKETLKVLGIDVKLFEEMVTSETVGVTKPDPKGFQYILGKTELPPSRHLMIGDREQVDLVPAKKLGMKTCLVWSDHPSKIADATLPNVYVIENLLN